MLGNRSLLLVVIYLIGICSKRAVNGADLRAWNEPFSPRNLQCELFRSSHSQEETECKYGTYEVCSVDVCLKGPGEECIDKLVSLKQCVAGLMCDCGKCVGCTAGVCYSDDMCPNRRLSVEIKRSRRSMSILSK